MPNLKRMNVEALMSLRDQVEKRLLELQAEIEKDSRLLWLQGQFGQVVIEGQEGPTKIS